MRFLRLHACVLPVIVDLFFWLIIPLVFLAIYFFVFNAPFSVFLPHLMMVALLWLGVFGVRLANWCFLNRLGVFQLVLGGLFVLLPPVMLLIFYVVALVGLASWGRIITWPIFSVYLVQVDFLLDVLDVSVIYFLAGSLLVFVFGYIFFRFVCACDLSRVIFAQLTVLGLMVISAFSVVVSIAGVFLYLPSLAHEYPQEPLSASFFPGRSSAFQTHELFNRPDLEFAEKNARLSYDVAANFDHRNVVLIVGDALRADHMGGYGYKRSTSPFFDESMGLHQTQLIKNVRSVCAESFCGLMALSSSRPLHMLTTKPITLHEILRKHGYQVQMMLSGDHTNFYGLKELYGEVDEYFDGTHQTERYVNDDLLLLEHVRHLPQYDGKSPVMFQFHLMSAHGLGKRHEVNGLFLPASNYYRWPSGNPRVPPAPDDALKAINYYDNGVRQFDRLVGEILRVLELKGYIDDALVVVTGDHGEMLGEKGGFGHQYGVEEQVLNIPLIFQRRGYRGGAYTEQPIVSQIDVAPTILYELGITAPSVWLGMPLQLISHPRKIDFQQAHSVGFYDIATYGYALKYWMNLITGEEFVYEIRDGVQGDTNVIYKFSAEKLSAWRREALMKSVLERHWPAQ